MAAVDVYGNGNDPYEQGGITGNPNFGVPSSPAAPSGPAAMNSYDQVNAAYQQYLGRSAGQDEYSNYWANTPNYAQSISSSPEAQAYLSANQQGTSPFVARGDPSGGGTGPQGGSTAPQQPAGGGDLMSRINAALAAAQSTDDPNYWFQKISADPNGAGSAWNYWAGRIAQGDGALAVRNGTMQKFQDPGAGGGGGSSSPYQPFSVPSPNTSVFSDPATQQYEQMLNQMMGRLNTSYQAPDYQSSIDALKAYMDQLNGPVYTPQQMDLMQTQALDPLAQQRDAARQQIIQHFSALGQGPDSGTVQAALLNSDQNFEKLRTQSQAGFASNAVGLQKQQQMQAASLAPQIAALEQANQTNNENRQMQAVNLGGIIPALSWQRLTGANSLIQPINTSSLLSQLQTSQQQGYNNSANYSSGLMQLLMQLMGS